MARRPLPPQGKRRHVVKIRLTATERDTLHEAARLSGLPDAIFIRRAALGARIRPKPSRQTSELVRQLAAIGNNLNQLARKANSGFAPAEGELRRVLREVVETIRRI